MNQKNNIMETNVPAAAPAEPASSRRDAAALIPALVLAAIFWACFGLESMDLPHLGVLVLTAAHFAAVAVTLGKRARLNAGSLFCAAASLALAASCTLYASGVFVLMNCFVILLTAAMATFSLSGHIRCGQADAIPRTVLLALLAFFTYLGRPFRGLAQAFRGRHRAKQGPVVLAVAVAVPVLAVVLWLLSSADAVFAAVLPSLRLDALPEGALWRVLRVLLAAPFLASALVFIRREPPVPAAGKAAAPRRAGPFLPVTLLLDGVYVVFCAIQARFLFGSEEAVSMAGGWAEYARSGFFQLVAVAAIDLGLCLLATDATRFADRGGKVLRAALGLLLALTVVILFSAFWRMRLYILAFGMSVLRLLTLWAMGVIAVGLLTAGWKLARPGFGFFRRAGSFALALWCVMNLAGPCRMIASYNVDRYLSGQLAQVDVDYLSSLSADALPALEHLAEADPATGAASAADRLREYASEPVSWPEWCWNK